MPFLSAAFGDLCAEGVTLGVYSTKQVIKTHLQWYPCETDVQDHAKYLQDKVQVNLARSYKLVGKLARHLAYASQMAVFLQNLAKVMQEILARHKQELLQVARCTFSSCKLLGFLQVGFDVQDDTPASYKNLAS